MRIKDKFVIGLVGLSAILAAPQAYSRDEGSRPFRHVLLISIDGMHAVDFINCANGISGVNGGAPYCPNLADLQSTGINYLGASTSKPSDSFPGLMALVSGGSPRTVGAFYDVAYDRSLDPPALTTGNGVAGSPGACTPNTIDGTAARNRPDDQFRRDEMVLDAERVQILLPDVRQQDLCRRRSERNDRTSHARR